MNLNLKNKNAFVGGSSKGIGRATAIELASLGANVTLAARNEEKLNAVLEQLDLNKVPLAIKQTCCFKSPAAIIGSINVLG